MVKKLVKISVLTALALTIAACGDSAESPAPVCGNGIVEEGEECDGTPDCTLLCTLNTGPTARTVSRELFCLLGPATIDETTGLPVTDPDGQTEGGMVLGTLPATLSVNPAAEFTTGSAVEVIIAFDAIIPQTMSANFIVPAYAGEPDRDPTTDPIILGDVTAMVNVNGTPTTLTIERLTTDADMDMIPDDGDELFFAIDDPANPGTALPVEVPIGPFVGTGSVTIDGASPTVDFLIEGVSFDMAAVPIISALSMSSRLDPAVPNADSVVDCLFLDQYPVGSATPEYLTFDAM